MTQTAAPSLVNDHVEHMRRRGLADGSIGKRRRRLVRFDAVVGLSGAEPEDVETFLDNRDLSAKTRYDWVSDLANFYQWAIDWGHLETNPTLRVVRPKCPRRLPNPIATGDLVVGLQMAEPTMRAWLTLAAYGGLRVGEIGGLTVDSLLWDDKLIRVIGKGDKERMVPMHPEVERVLRARRLPSRGRVFRRPRGGGYPAAQVSREVSLYFESIGVSATAHMLRHWFGTKLYAACRDLRVVQEVMGHASPSTTAMYADWSRPEARSAVASLSVEASDATLFSEWAS